MASQPTRSTPEIKTIWRVFSNGVIKHGNNMENISLFSRFHFSHPKKTKIVIFDKIGSEVLIKTILHDKSYTLLPGRGEEFYITIQIFFRMMKKIRVMDFIKTKNIKCDLVNFYYLTV